MRQQPRFRLVAGDLQRDRRGASDKVIRSKTRRVVAVAAIRTARRTPLALLIVAGLITYLLVANQQAVGASNLPADKMTVTASNTAVTGPGTDVVVLQARMRTSAPADLLLQVTSECTILSSITNEGVLDTQQYTSTIAFSVEVDSRPVPVVPPPSTTGAAGAGPSGPDDGRVVFCNREFQRRTVFTPGIESIEDVERTSQSSGFNWVAMNVGAGIHVITVKAHFTNTSTAKASSQGVINKRSLTAEVTNYFVSQPA